MNQEIQKQVQQIVTDTTAGKGVQATATVIDNQTNTVVAIALVVLRVKVNLTEQVNPLSNLALLLSLIFLTRLLLKEAIPKYSYF